MSYGTAVLTASDGEGDSREAEFGRRLIWEVFGGRDPAGSLRAVLAEPTARPEDDDVFTGSTTRCLACWTQIPCSRLRPRSYWPRSTSASSRPGQLTRRRDGRPRRAAAGLGQAARGAGCLPAGHRPEPPAGADHAGPAG